MEESSSTPTWPTTIGAVCIVVGGLTLFGGCLSLTSMSELEQLHTAIPFGEGEITEELQTQLIESGPPFWVTSTMSSLTILLSFTLIYLGMNILKQDAKARVALLVWAGTYLVLTLAFTLINWYPRWDLVQQNNEVKGIFLAQLVISLPMYLVLPVFLLVYLNKRHVRDEVARWR